MPKCNVLRAGTKFFWFTLTLPVPRKVAAWHKISAKWSQQIFIEQLRRGEVLGAWVPGWHTHTHTQLVLVGKIDLFGSSAFNFFFPIRKSLMEGKEILWGFLPHMVYGISAFHCFPIVLGSLLPPHVPSFWVSIHRVAGESEPTFPRLPFTFWL